MSPFVHLMVGTRSFGGPIRPFDGGVCERLNDPADIGGRYKDRGVLAKPLEPLDWAGERRSRPTIY